MNCSAGGRCGIRLLGLALLAVVLVAGCRRAPPEQRLRERISQMQEALETRRPADFIVGVAEDFSGEGGLDRDGLRNFLRVQMLRHQAIGVNIGPIEVELHGDRATVKFVAVATGGSGGLIPESARPWSVRSGWRDGPDGWQVIQADWRPAL